MGGLVCRRLMAWRRARRCGGAPRGWCAASGQRAPLCAPDRPRPTGAQRRQRPHPLCEHPPWTAVLLRRSRQAESRVRSQRRIELVMAIIT